MKRVLILTGLWLFSLAVGTSQWVYLPNVGLNDSWIWFSYAVNDQVYWIGRGYPDTVGVAVTTDGGATWKYSKINEGNAWRVVCIYALDGTTAWVASDGIYKTTNGGNTWTKQVSAFPTVPDSGFPNTVYFFDANNGVAMGDPNGGSFEIYTTTNGGTNWVRVSSGDIPAPLADEYGITSEHAACGDSYWFSTTQDRIFRSTDRGYTWSASLQLPPDARDAPGIAFRDALHGIAIRDKNLFSRTIDGGQTWFADSLPSWVIFAGKPAYVPGTAATYVVTTWGKIGSVMMHVVLFSTDDGVTWRRMDAWPYNGEGGITPQHWTSVNSGWAGLMPGPGLYRWSGYTGRHIWRVGSSLGYPDGVVGSVGQIYEVTVGNFGTAPTTLSAFNFSSANFSLVNRPALPLTLQPWEAVDLSIAFTPQAQGSHVDSLLILSDATNHPTIGVRLSGSARLTGVEESGAGQVPAVYALSQNYPDPFNPSTRIEFSVPKPTLVTVKVFNLLGEEVATLASREFNAGRYTVDWNASSAPSGVYFYRLTAGDPSASSAWYFTQTKKLILIR